MEFGQRILRIESDGGVQGLQSLLGSFEGELHGADVNENDGVFGINSRRMLIVDFGETVALLFGEYRADAEPGVVVPGVLEDGRAEAGHGLFQFLGDDELVAEQCVAVGEFGIDLGMKIRVLGNVHKI